MLTECHSQIWKISNETLFNSNATWGTWKQSNSCPGLGQCVSLPMFSISLIAREEILTAPAALPVTAFLEVGLANFSTDHGEYTLTNCNLIPVILEYDIVVDASAHNPTTVTLPRHPSQGRFVAVANNTHSREPAVMDGQSVELVTTDYITEFVTLIYRTNSSFYHRVDYDELWFPDGATLNLESYKHMISGGDTIKFSDPTSDIVFAYNEFMFRGAGEYITSSVVESDLRPHVAHLLTHANPSPHCD